MLAVENALPTMSQRTGSLERWQASCRRSSRSEIRVAVGGYVNEVSRSAIGVRGISDKVQLGDIVA